MIRKFKHTLTSVLIAAATQVFATPPPVQEPSSPEQIKAALSGGVPLGRWKEGLLFEGISPHPCVDLHPKLTH